MVKHIARYTSEQMIAVDNLMLSSESLLARTLIRLFQRDLDTTPAKYVENEGLQEPICRRRLG
jgi:transcriptional regulator GlxA family with amidase domain